MLERTTAESSNELTATDTSKGMHDAGLNPACGPLSFLSIAQARVPRKGRRWGYPAQCEGWLNLIEFD